MTTDKLREEIGLQVEINDKWTDDYVLALENKCIKLTEQLEAINYTHCCKSDSELLHTEVFNLANKLAINGYGNEAVKMHGICNGM
jgi:hypothetical protein